MVSVDYHSIYQVDFIIGNLNYTIDFFFFLLSFISGPNSIVKIDDRSSKVAEKSWVCWLNGEIFDGIEKITVFEVLCDEEIGLWLKIGFGDVLLFKELYLLLELGIFVGLSEQLCKIFDLNIGKLLIGEFEPQVIVLIFDKEVIGEKVLIAEIPALARFTSYNQWSGGGFITSGPFDSWPIVYSIRLIN